MDKEEKRKEWLQPVIIIVALTVFLVPFIIYCYALCNGLDSGNLGDTIGGSTAPFIGLLSAILLYFSFSSQVRANKIARDEATFKFLLGEFERLKKELGEFEYIEKTITNSVSEANHYKGLDGFEKLTLILLSLYGPSASPKIYTNLEESCKKLLYYQKLFYIFIKELSNLNKSQNVDYKRIIESKVRLYYDDNLSIKMDILLMIDSENESNENLKIHLSDLRKYSKNTIKLIAGFEKENEEVEFLN